MQYHVIAEHGGGQSISHACRFETIDDPVLAVPKTIEAPTAEAAEAAAREILRRLVSETNPCSCERSESFAARLVSDAWYSSISVTVMADARWDEEEEIYIVRDHDRDWISHDGDMWTTRGDVPVASSDSIRLIGGPRDGEIVR